MQNNKSEIAARDDLLQEQMLQIDELEKKQQGPLASTNSKTEESEVEAMK